MNITNNVLKRLEASLRIHYYGNSHAILQGG